MGLRQSDWLGRSKALEQKKLQEKPIAGFCFFLLKVFLQAALFTMPTLKVTELKLTGR